MSLSVWVSSIFRSDNFWAKSWNFSAEYFVAGVFSRYVRVSRTMVAAFELPPDGCREIKETSKV